MQIAGILASQDARLALQIYDAFKLEFDLILVSLKANAIKPESLTAVAAILTLIYNLSKDAKVLARLQGCETPLAIYDAIKESDPLAVKHLIKKIDEKVLGTLTQLVLSLIVGNPDLESKLSKMVIQDLEVL